ncbi:subtilisin-like protein [Lactarius quietus]|nr:subtilisin-like protein [Lactarius quietus]
MCYYGLLLFFLAAVPLTSLAAPASPWGDMRVKHFWQSLPHHWEYLNTPSDNTTIDLRIALHPDNEDALIEALYEVSGPSNPKYREYLSQVQVADLVAPHSDTVKLVESWLNFYDVPSSSFSMSHLGNWLKVTGVRVSQANSLLGASYRLYRHAETNDTILRTMSYAIPAALQDLVQTVTPSTYFPSPPTLRKTLRMRNGSAALEEAGGVTSRQSGDNGIVRPVFLQTLYNTLNYVPNATDRNGIGIAGFSGLYPSPSDLDMFMERYAPDAVNLTYSVVQINGGGYSTGDPSSEGDADMEYSVVLTYPTPHTFYSTGGQPPFTPDSNAPSNNNEPYLDWLEYLLRQPNIPQTMISGYGEDEQTVPMDYATTVCHLFAQLGARGVSIIVDGGQGAVGAGSCEANDGSGKVQFLPTFPATCKFKLFVPDLGPYVTSVGGTMNIGPEVAAPSSSGGFSNYFKVPSYQNDAVPPYLQTIGSLNDGLYNTSGRGCPDVATQFPEFSVVVNGLFDYTSGCTATVFGSVVSLLNDFLLSQNKHALGFLNPWLYGPGLAGLNDITSGSNPGCNTTGFPAVVGWDAVTGLGTPNFVLLQLVLNSTGGVY